MKCCPGPLAGALVVAVACGCRLLRRASSPGDRRMIEPKADAGFFLMAAKRGFFEKEGLKVDGIEVKDDTIGMQGAAVGRGRQLSTAPPARSLRLRAAPM